MNGFLRDKDNKPSMMRLAMMVSMVMGSLLILSGIYGVLSVVDNATVLVNAGAGLMSVSGISKAFQARVE